MSEYIETNLKRAKEISDLESEIQKTKELLQKGKLDELSAHLQHLNAKYFAETVSYNILHPFPPKDLQESAKNCISFLSSLLTTKTTDTGNK